MKSNSSVQYAKKQKTLNSKQRFIVAWFCNNGITEYCNKKKLFEEFSRVQEVRLSAFSARISELKALGFFEVTAEIKEDPLSMIQGPFYKFNTERYFQYLKDGGLGI